MASELLLISEMFLLIGVVAITVVISYLKMLERRGGGPPKALLNDQVKTELPSVMKELEARVLLQEMEIESLRFSLRTAEQTYFFWRTIAEKRAELLAELKSRDSNG